jgi:hypothetical protein
MELSTQAVAYTNGADALHVTYPRMPWGVVVHAGEKQEYYARGRMATIKTETEDGITGRAWCSRCGNSVHRSSHYCQHCGARFGPRRSDTACRDT